MKIEKLGNIMLVLGDCMDYMRECPDKSFDLAIVDPPYGLGCATWGMGHTADNRSVAREIYKARVNRSRHSGSGKLKGRVLNRSADKFENWDSAPGWEYFDELFRVSRNQIIWGGNYFPLPPTRCVICWDKVQPWENFSQIELAWTSFDYPAKLFRYDNRQTGRAVRKIHATEKPVRLYEWLLTTFAKEGDRILDTHGGSMSHAIAAHRLGYDLTIIEKDAEYYETAKARLIEYQRELKLF